MSHFRGLISATVVSFVLVAVACGEAAPAAQPATSPPAAPAPTAIQASFPLAIIDSDGEEVTFDKPPERIVAYDSDVVEILFAIGEGQRVVGTHNLVSYPPEADAIPRLGSAFDINVEAIVALEPDLVYLFFDRFLPDLERAGLKVLYLKTLSQDFVRVADNIRTWGRITGATAAAQAVATQFESRVQGVREVMAPYASMPTVFQDVGGFWTPGPDTLVGEVFDLLKLRNIAEDVSGYAQLSPEIIVERNPQIIITLDREAFMGNPAFADVLAVKNGRVYELNPDLLSIAGPRFADGIEELAKLVHPALFE